MADEHKLFKGRPFDRGIIALRALASPIQARLAKHVETTAEPNVYRSYNYHALGLAPCSKIRKAVEPLRV